MDIDAKHPRLSGRDLGVYREGWADALIWVLDHIDLTEEDEAEIVGILDAD